MASDGNGASAGGAPSGLVIDDLGDGLLRLIGDIDMNTAPTLRRRLEDDDSVVKVLDMREVTFLDSSGLVVLLLGPATAAQVRSHCDRRVISCATGSNLPG